MGEGGWHGLTHLPESEGSTITRQDQVSGIEGAVNGTGGMDLSQQLKRFVGKENGEIRPAFWCRPSATEGGRASIGNSG